MSAVLRKNLLNDLRGTFTMNNDHNEFLFDEEKTKKIMKKAKLWSTLKVIAITMIVTPIIIVIFWYGLRNLSLNSAQKVMDDIRIYNEISSPNVQMSDQIYDYHLFGGKIKTTTYKVFGDNYRPYIWEPLESDYNLLGTLTRNYVSDSIQMQSSESLAEANQFEKFNVYTGDREMFFYHPDISYNVYKDNMSELEQFRDTTLIELGISFDKAYHFDEIKSKLPSEVQLNWLWVDTYTTERLDFMRQDQNTITANSPFIYGIQSEQSKPIFAQYEGDEVERFIRNIELLLKSKNFEWESNQLYQSLVGENGTLENNDVKIIGAVVTGTPEQLASLQGQTYIKASTFGVIFDRK